MERFSFGYEDTDKKIEMDLYGLVFEINKKKILDKDIKNLDCDNEEKILIEIEDVLGKGSIEKINRQRINDGYSEVTLDVAIAILKCIYKAYIETTTGELIDGIEESSNKMTQKAENLTIYNDYNREQRRYSKRNWHKRNYRRY